MSPPTVNLTVKDLDNWRVDYLIDEKANNIPDREFLQWETEETLTFGEVYVQVRRLARQLRDLGMRKGDPVLLYLPNSIDYLLLILSLQYIGAIPAPMNVNYRERFILNVGSKTEAVAVITTTELADNLSPFDQASLRALGHVILLDGDEDRTAQLTSRLSAQRVSSGSALDRHSGAEGGPGEHLSYQDVGLYMGTSGTTGASKSIIVPHAHVYFWAEQNSSVLQIDSASISANMFPFFHGNALFCAMYPALVRGAKGVLFEKFSVNRWIERLREVHATHTTLLGSTMQWIHNTSTQSDDTKNDLQIVWAAPIEDHFEAPFRERFGIRQFVTAFGQSETSLPIMAPRDEPRPPRAVGKLVDEWFEIRVADPISDQPVEAGQVGELLVRPKSPWIMSLGYQGDEAATAKTMRNLWWHTGDAVWQDRDGWFYHHGRTNDAIRVNGENVSADEVEMEFLAFGSVGDSAAVGVPADELGGEHEILAFVVAVEGTQVDLGELVGFLEPRLPKFAVPRYYEIIDSLPRNEMGKLQRAKLRERGVSDRTWDRTSQPPEIENQRTNKERGTSR